MGTVYSRIRGPKAKRGRSRMRMGEYAVGEYRGVTLLQIIAILIILGLLSVVAIPRYMEARRDRQREAEEAEAHGYIRALHSVLTLNTANHYLRGTGWVEDGEHLMGLLEDGWAMPQGMRYRDNVWTDERTGLAWEFKEASDRLPPRIRRVEQRPPLEAWDMEPIGQVSQAPPPTS
jgi:type II secretory pathway pseudopilin PulG